MKHYTTLLFDADGTLLNFHKTELYALKNTFENHHIPFTDELYQTYTKINHQLWKDFEDGIIDKNTLVYTRFVKLFELFNIQDDGVAFEDEYQARLGEGGFLLDNVHETLSVLQKSYQLYIVTNGVIQTQYSRLKSTDIQKYFLDVFVSEKVGYQKPQKEYFDYCFQRIKNFDLDKTLIIGDSLSSDIKGGILAGIDTCWINPTHQEKPHDMNITFEIESVKDLLDIL